MAISSHFRSQNNQKKDLLPRRRFFYFAIKINLLDSVFGIYPVIEERL